MNCRIQALNFYLVLFVFLFVSAFTVKASELSIPEIVNKVQPTIVVIESKRADGIARGSGFVIDSSGIIVTNVHVISGALSVGVKLSSGEVYDQIQIRAYDERKDLALIQIRGFNIPSATLGNSDLVKVGEKVVLIGNPLGVLEGSVTSGIVSGIRTVDGVRIIQTDAASNPGNSGGPLLNEKGEAIGVLSFKLKGTENLNFGIPINYARGLLSLDNKLTLKDLNERINSSSLAFQKTDTNTFPRKWKSLTGGFRMVITQNRDNISVEVVLPDLLKAMGGFRTMDFKKDGTKYVGTSRFGAPCTYYSWGDKRNFCYDNRSMEITLFTSSRIEGVAYEPQKGAKFNCKDCTFDPPDLVKSPFVWIPE